MAVILNLQFQISEIGWCKIRDQRPYILIVSKKIGIISKFLAWYWTLYFEFSKSDSRLVISEPKNPYIPFFNQNIGIFSKFYSSFWDLQTW